MFSEMTLYEDINGIPTPVTGYRENVEQRGWHYSTITYTGPFLHGLKHGNGIEYHRDGGDYYTIYTGQWKHNRIIRGTSKLMFKDDDFITFTGTFHNNKKKFGMQVCVDEGTCFGDFERGLYNGIDIRENGIVYKITNYEKQDITNEYKHYIEEYPLTLNDELFPNNDLTGLCTFITEWLNQEDYLVLIFSLYFNTPLL